MTLLGPSGMPEIREDILNEISNEAAKYGIEAPIEVGSDHFVQATGVAAACMFMHARIDGAKDACTPNTAQEGPDLDRWQEALRLPDVEKSYAAGKVTVRVVGSATGLIADGQPGTIGGQRFIVVNGPWSGLVSGDDVDVRMVNSGTIGNKKAGTTGRFLNPPLNISPELKVSKYKPITGGYDDEDGPRKRRRILNRLGTTAGGGNWGHLRELSWNSSPAVQQVFVFPAIGGPATDKTVVLKAFDRDIYNFSREFPEGAQGFPRGAIHKTVSTGFNYILDTATDEPVDVAVKVSLPLSKLVGGNGRGWTDAVPWPPLEGGDTRVRVSAIGASGTITVDASTTTEPIPSQTRVAWWSRNDMNFHVRTVTAVGGSSGAWVLTPDAPFVDETGATPAVDDFISPNAENLKLYAEAWIDLMENLGAGENTTDSQLLLQGRGARHPTPEEEDPANLTTDILLKFKEKNTEVSDPEYSYRSKTSPTVPASVDDKPNVLVPRHFGIYPL